MSAVQDMRGLVFGCWKIISRAENQLGGAGDERVQWNVLCECGNKFIVATRNIKRRREFPSNCNRCFNLKTKTPKLKYGRNVNGFIDRKNILNQGCKE